jgi:hypothetical protein
MSLSNPSEKPGKYGSSSTQGSGDAIIDIDSRAATLVTKEPPRACTADLRNCCLVLTYQALYCHPLKSSGILAKQLRYHVSFAT